MTAPFRTPCELPSPYEREVLTIIIEECAEVQQRATKMLRFGRDEVQPGQVATNAERLSLEVGDLRELFYIAKVAGLIDGGTIQDGRMRKRIQLAKFMQTKAPTP